jgi:hypothetical protein
VVAVQVLLHLLWVTQSLVVAVELVVIELQLKLV